MRNNKETERNIFGIFIIEEVRNTVQARKKLRESLRRRCIASVKTGFQNFVPTIWTLKMRHVLETRVEADEGKRKANSNSRNRYEIEFVEFECS